MAQSEPVTALLQAVEAFGVPLRSGEGFNEAGFQSLVDALRACATAWADADTIPKLAANVLVDLAPATEAASYAYRDAVAERIREASYTLADLIRDCVAVEGTP